MSVLKKIDSLLGRMESATLILILIFMVSFSALQIVLRLFNMGIVWFDPFLRSSVLWTAFLGGAKATQKQNHVKMDLLDHLLSGSLKKILRHFLAFLGCLLSLYLFVVASHFVLEERGYGDVSFLNVQTWHIALAFPLGFFLMSFHFLVRAFPVKDSVSQRES